MATAQYEVIIQNSHGHRFPGLLSFQKAGPHYQNVMLDLRNQTLRLGEVVAYNDLYHANRRASNLGQTEQLEWALVLLASTMGIRIVEIGEYSDGTA